MKKSIVYLKRVINAVVSNDFFGMASEMGFMSVLGIFPAMLFLTAVCAWVGKHEFMAPVFATMSTFMPDDVYNLIITVLNEVMFYSKGGFWAALGFIITLILTTNTVAIILKGMNRAYQVEETRSFLYTRMLSLLMVIVDTVLFFFAIDMIIFGKLFLNFCVNYLNLGKDAADLWMFLRWPVSFVFLYVIAFLQYYILPDLKGPEILKLKSTVPGTFFFCIFWLVGSWGFSVYINSWHTYNFVYGTIGAFAVLMVWMYYSSILILIGAEINSQVYNRLEITENSK